MPTRQVGQVLRHGGRTSCVHSKLESPGSSVDCQRGILSELSSLLGRLSTTADCSRNQMHVKSVRWLKAPQERRYAWPLAAALGVRDVISPRNRIAIVVGLGCGLRQGEVFGLSLEAIDRGRLLCRARPRSDAPPVRPTCSTRPRCTYPETGLRGSILRCLPLGSAGVADQAHGLFRRPRPG